MQYYTDSSSYSSSFSSSSSSVGSFLRQLSNSSKDLPWGSYSASKRWSSNCSMIRRQQQQQQQHSTDEYHHQQPPMDHYHSSNLYVEGLNKLYYNHHHHDQDQNYNVVKKKRVMVVVDSSNRSKQAMMWALTHVSNKGDLLTLLHIIPNTNTTSSSSAVNGGGGDGGSSSSLAASLVSLCKACKPEVEIEGLVIEGPKLVGTVLSQVKKLDVSVLVLGQKKPSPLSCLFQCGGGSRNHGLGDAFVEECVNSAECLALAVRKQSKSVGGYLISTRWQKNFWLLA